MHAVLKESRQFFPELFVCIVRLPGCMYVIVFVPKYFQYVIVSPGELFSVSVESMLYQRKVYSQYFTIHVGKFVLSSWVLLHCHQVVDSYLK
jgi:hypothetical protein